MVEDSQILENEYCPPLDPALVHAIFSDYGDAPDGIQLARALLDGIKQSALEEQLTDFDPSGSSGDTTRSSAHVRSCEAESNGEDCASHTTVTEFASLSSDFSTLNVGNKSGSGSEASSEGSYFKQIEHYDTPAKELLLVETFPTLRSELIAYTLKKCNNDLSKATDELLNHVYFVDIQSSPNEEVVIAKGIDAFSEDHHVPQRGKKMKAKKKQKNSLPFGDGSSDALESNTSPAPTANKWLQGNRDIEFIASRTISSTATVSSLYYNHGASCAATIMAMIEKDIAANKRNEVPDATTLQYGLDLNSDFPNLELDHAIALIRLAAPSTAKAHELAKALTTKPNSPGSARGGIEVIARYAPVRLSDPMPETSTPPSLAPTAAQRTAASLSVARGQAFTQASEAYRKGKSDPHMKAVAGYYAQLGHDLNANLKVESEAEADDLVASQSSPRHLDLHGVSVHNATRIAREKVRAWWIGLGEERIPGSGRRGVGEGYRIITGLGRHSEGGRAKLGPAVAKTLVKEGWKVEVGTGDLVVIGLAKRR